MNFKRSSSRRALRRIYPGLERVLRARGPWRFVKNNNHRCHRLTTLRVMPILYFLFFLSWIELALATNQSPDVQHPISNSTLLKNRMKRTLYGRLCPTGCASCSAINGCVTCRPRYFLHLQWTGLRQLGVCVISCPIGHLGIRTKHYRYCARCRVPNCDVCLTKHYCTRCQGLLYEFRGQCLDSCPEGLVPGNSSRECLPKVDCLVSEWGQWGVCAKNGRSCGFKYGVQTRVRQIIQFPSATGKNCPENTENRKCVIDQPVCPKDLLLPNVKMKTSGKSRKRNRDKKKHRKRKRGKKRRQRRNKLKHGNGKSGGKMVTTWTQSTTEISNQIYALVT